MDTNEQRVREGGTKTSPQPDRSGGELESREDVPSEFAALKSNPSTTIAPFGQGDPSLAIERTLPVARIQGEQDASAGRETESEEADDEPAVSPI